MKYTPKEIEGNVNISKASPVKDFFELVAKILGVLLVVYILLALLVDIIAPRISIGTEKKLSRLFTSSLEKKARTKEDRRLQEILDSLVEHADTLPEFNYKIYVEESKDVNALALPGGNIVVFSALLKEAGSANELAFILAHELGHFSNRDHLRGLGHNLVFLMISTVLFGSDSSTSQVIANVITGAEMHFSQKQEKAADIFALRLLNKRYGNVAGALDFFEKMAAKEKLGEFFYVFASHPYPKKRVEALKKEIEVNGYTMGQKMPVDIPQDEGPGKDKQDAI